MKGKHKGRSGAGVPDASCPIREVLGTGGGVESPKEQDEASKASSSNKIMLSLILMYYDKGSIKLFF